MKLNKNTILITGGTSGIGLALAKKFLILENNVIVCGRNEEKLKRINENNPQIYTIKCDVTNKKEVNDLKNEIKKKFGKINILINNAGIQYRYNILNEGNVMNKVNVEMKVNFEAVVNLTELFLPMLHSSSEAAIINISSMLGIVPKKTAPIYCASKAAVHIFTKTLMYQLEESNIKVFDIIPPIVNTNMTKIQENVPKMKLENFIQEVIKGLKKDKYTIKPGMAKYMLLLNRFLPNLVEKIFKNK